MDKQKIEFEKFVTQYSEKISGTLAEMTTDSQSNHDDFDTHVAAMVCSLAFSLQVYMSECSKQKLKSKVLEDLMHNIYEEDKG